MTTVLTFGVVLVLSGMRPWDEEPARTRIVAWAERHGVDGSASDVRDGDVRVELRVPSKSPDDAVAVAQQAVDAALVDCACRISAVTGFSRPER